MNTPEYIPRYYFVHMDQSQCPWPHIENRSGDYEYRLRNEAIFKIIAI